MSDSFKQDQTAGDHSTAIQAGRDVHVGLITVSEARQIALDVFRANALELAGIARDLFEARGREFIDRYLEELQQRKPEALDALRDPDMQIALFTAQREYARSGDQDLSELLVDILVDRAAQRDRDLKRIVLNESLTVAPKLTPEQFDILSLSFVIRYTKRLNVGNPAQFSSYMLEGVLPFSKNLPKHNAPYQHLQYTGCASIDIGEIAVGGIIFNVYPGLFSSGFTREEFAAIAPPDQWIGTLLIPCFHKPALFQVAAVGLDDIAGVCERLSVPLEHREKIRDLQSNHRMSQQEIEEYLRLNVSGSDILLDLWEQSPLKHLSLTTVGIAIAHANIRRKLKRDDYNLSVWIP